MAMCSFYFAVALVCGLIAVGTSMSVSELKRNLKLRGTSVGNIQAVGDYYYFSDPTLRNYQEAEAFCRNVDPTADLAFLEGRSSYNQLRLGSDPPVGSYWITGKEKIPDGNTDDTSKYDNISFNCESLNGTWSIKGITLKAPTAPQNCLLLVKGSSPANTYIQPTPCTTRYRTLCSMPIKDGVCDSGSSSDTE